MSNCRAVQHTPMQYIFWSTSDIVDNDDRITGLPRAMQKNGEPRKLVALLGQFFETAERIIDEAVQRSKLGVIRIFYVAGAHRWWQSEGGSFEMNAVWDDIVTLLRARVNQRIERWKIARIQPKMMILDGACMYPKLRHNP
eukprot:435968-Pyramimonas_sp.AAC.1